MTTSTDTNSQWPTDESLHAPEDLKRFISAIFDNEDCILIRPTETWMEGKRRKSQPVYKDRCYPIPANLVRAWPGISKSAAATRACLYFGVCPRFGVKGYDLAWQIRTIRVPWADLDHCAPEEALKRCEAAGLPRPSGIVNSGYGVHCYWILNEPYFINDVPDPTPVLTEWIERSAAQKKLRRQYIIVEIQPEDGAPAIQKRVYLYQIDAKTGGDSKTPNPDFQHKLSDKAKHLQRVIAGIGSLIGGDCTHDLARLLRLPGTLNRKCERNGKTPVPCTLFECDPGRRYSFAEFERFAESAPEKVKAEEVVKVKLPGGGKLTAGRRNTLNDLLNVCAIASTGQRSEPDFAACAFAIEHGLDKEEVWQESADVGKFAQRGREYFDLTWDKAKARVQEKIYDRAYRKAAGNSIASTNGIPWDSNGKQTDASVDSHESLDDPHKLARVWLAEKTHTDGPTFKYYREEFHEYRSTHWRPIPDPEMKATIARFCKRELDTAYARMLASGASQEDNPTVPKVTLQLVSNVLQAIAGEVLLPRTVEQPVMLDDRGAPEQKNCIALTNGILDVDALLSGEANVLLSHTPKWFSPVCLPYQFDINADCPTWRKFLQRNLAGESENIALLQEFAGYLLLPDVSMQRFLMMAGDGANGKSVICAVLGAMLGEANVESVPLEMFGARFRLVETLGKLANIVPEVNELDKIAEGQLKAFVTGDPLQFERKFKQPFKARPTARLVLATNNPPQFSDKSDGIWRRVLLLLFRVQIPEAERIAGMDSVEFWHRNGELPGILNWALAGLHRLRSNKRFIVPESCQHAADKLRVDSNPARKFLQEFYQEGEGFLPTADVYAAYCEWSKKHGHHALADVGFGREVARRFPRVQRKKKVHNNARIWAYHCLCHSTDEGMP